MRHYSPNIDSYLFDGSTKLELGAAVLLDFGGRFASFKSQVKQYADLSVSGNCEEAISRVYDVLRWAETNKDCSFVLITNLSQDAQGQSSQSEHFPALFDRLFRATSGKLA